MVGAAEAAEVDAGQGEVLDGGVDELVVRLAPAPAADDRLVLGKSFSTTMNLFFIQYLLS